MWKTAYRENNDRPFPSRPLISKPALWRGSYCMSLFSNFVDSVTTAVDSVTLNKRSDGLIHSVIKVNQECFKLQKLLGEG